MRAGTPKGQKKKGPQLPKIFTSFKKSSPINEQGSFDSGDGIVISEKGMEDGEQLFELGDFEKVRELGAGTQGVVNEVRHRQTQELYAMKMQPLQQEEDVREKQIRELRMLRKSRHANVVSLYDAFYREGYVYLLMELMDCGTLRALLREVKSIPEPFLGKITLMMLDGLEYIHREFHVLHRDVKPENILLNTRGEVKLSDFGVIGIVESTQGNANTFTGSSMYMSLERLKGEAHGLKSDCWSLGMIVIECALGRHPLEGPDGRGAPSVFNLVHMINGQDPCAPLEGLNYSDAFKDFCRKCLVRDPEKRLSSTELLDHAWIKQCRNDTDTNLTKWLSLRMSF